MFRDGNCAIIDPHYWGENSLAAGGGEPHWQQETNPQKTGMERAVKRCH